MLTTQTTWSGDVTGSVAWQYNNDFNKILETVTGASGTAQTVFGYDNDQLLTCASPVSCSGTSAANALRLTRSAQNGLITGIALGNTTETLSYNTFGELARQTSAYSATPIADITYDAAGVERDKLGRIVQKTEVVLGVTQGLPVHVRRPPAAHGRHHQRRARRALRVRRQRQPDGGVQGGARDLDGDVRRPGPVAELRAVGVYVHGQWGDGDEDGYVHGGGVDVPVRCAREFAERGVAEWGFRRVPGGWDGAAGGEEEEWGAVEAVGVPGCAKPVAELDGSGDLVAEYAYGAKSNVPDYVVRGGRDVSGGERSSGVAAVRGERGRLDRCAVPGGLLELLEK